MTQGRAEGLATLLAVTTLLLAPTPAQAEESSAAPAEEPSTEAAPAEAPTAEEDAAPSPEAAPAEETPTETPEQRATIAAAEMHFTLGVRLVRTEHWEAALAEFDASFEALPNRSALFNRALCLRHLYRYPEAIAALEEFLERYEADSAADQTAEARGLLAAMRALLTEVTVEVNLRGAAVSVDGEPAGETPLASPLLLLSGPHEIEVRSAGYLPERRDIVVVADRDMHLDVELRERPSRGVLRVSSNVDGANLLIDGQQRGTIPFHGVIDEGPHEVEVEADGYATGARPVVIEANGDLEISIQLERRIRAHRAWFWSVLGLTVAGALTTTGLGIGVVALDNDYDHNADDAPDRYNAGEDLMRGTDIALGISLSLAAAVVVLAFFTDWDRDRPTTDDEPEATADPYLLRPLF